MADLWLCSRPATATGVTQHNNTIPTHALANRIYSSFQPFKYLRFPFAENGTRVTSFVCRRRAARRCADCTHTRHTLAICDL